MDLHLRSQACRPQYLHVRLQTLWQAVLPLLVAKECGVRGSSPLWSALHNSVWVVSCGFWNIDNHPIFSIPLSRSAIQTAHKQAAVRQRRTFRKGKQCSVCLAASGV